MVGEAASMPTLGERLDVHARRLAARLLPSLPWAGPLEVLIDHASSLAAPFDGRFDRVESVPDGSELGLPEAWGGGAWRSSAERGSVPPPAAPAGSQGQDLGPATRLPGGPTEARPNEARPAEGRPLPTDVRSRLRDVAGRGADLLRVHDDEVADRLARAYRADAVTVGHDVYFRQGRLRPREQRGFGLLAHEATHVLALLRPGAAWHRATSGGVRHEEQDALARERATAPSHATMPPHGPNAEAVQPPWTSAASAQARAPEWSAPASPPATRPMTAAEDRDTTSPPPAPPDLDVEALRRGLVNDLMRQLRTEFERGG
jgi:hypothetical protein